MLKAQLTIVILRLLLVEVGLGVVISNTVLVGEGLGGQFLINGGSTIPGTIRPGQGSGKEGRCKHNLQINVKVRLMKNFFVYIQICEVFEVSEVHEVKASTHRKIF